MTHPLSVGTRIALSSLSAFLLVACTAPSSGPHTRFAAEVSSVVRDWNAEALQDLLDYARSQRTTGLLIIQDRRVIAEHNWPLSSDAAAFRAAFVHGQAPDGALLEDVASQQKSFIAILIGVAVDHGLLDVDKPVSHYLGVGWSQAPREHESRITVRHLIEMNSGLTEDLRAEAQPGERFFYNTPAYALTKRVLERAANRPLDELTRRWLTEPLGMDQTTWRPRPPALADVGNPTGLVSTPRDIARMGRLVLDRGLAPDGRRVISTAQLDRMLRATATNPAYGRLWWLNGGSHAVLAGANARRREGPLILAAPPDLVVALGAHDRKLYVVPSRQLIVVRTGPITPARDFDQQLWRRLSNALPGGG